MLATPRLCTAHAAALAATLDTTGLRTVVHGPNSLLVGHEMADRAFEGLLSWASEIGAEQVVYHARALPDDPTSETALQFETRSLARLAKQAERLGVTIAIENLAPVFPGLELLSANPMTLRGLAHRIGSDQVGICLDLGHANIVADLRHTSIERLIEPVLDVVTVFHVHDNLGGRLAGASSHRPTAGSTRSAWTSTSPQAAGICPGTGSPRSSPATKPRSSWSCTRRTAHAPRTPTAPRHSAWPRPDAGEPQSQDPAAPSSPPGPLPAKTFLDLRGLPPHKSRTRHTVRVGARPRP